MERQSGIAKELENIKGREQYDSACKRVLSQKSILAWIMKSCLHEYKDESIADIRDLYIEGTPQVASVPVERERTNAPERIVGVSAEDKSDTEGTALYDILFTALLPGTGEPVYLIINVEAQGRANLKYPLIKRGIYYAGRILTAQEGRYFKAPDYNKIRKVYSIWVCMNPKAGRDDTIAEYHIEKFSLEGGFEEPLTDYDLMTVVMINVGKGNQQKAKSLLRLLRILFAKDMSPREKQSSLEGDYDIPMTEEIEKGMSEMCNLSMALIEEGIEKGIAEGEARTARNIASSLLALGKMSIEEIASVSRLTIDEVRSLATAK